MSRSASKHSALVVNLGCLLHELRVHCKAKDLFLVQGFGFRIDQKDGIAKHWGSWGAKFRIALDLDQGRTQNEHRR